MSEKSLLLTEVALYGNSILLNSSPKSGSKNRGFKGRVIFHHRQSIIHLRGFGILYCERWQICEVLQVIVD